MFSDHGCCFSKIFNSRKMSKDDFSLLFFPLLYEMSETAPMCSETLHCSAKSMSGQLVGLTKLASTW